MIKVLFLKSGTPYGYGYTAGEFGVVTEEDFNDRKGFDSKSNAIVLKGLQSLGVVRKATDAEYAAAEKSALEKIEARKVKVKKGGITAKTAAPLIQGGKGDTGKDDTGDGE